MTGVRKNTSSLISFLFFFISIRARKKMRVNRCRALPMYIVERVILFMRMSTYPMPEKKNLFYRKFKQQILSNAYTKIIFFFSALGHRCNFFFRASPKIHWVLGIIIARLLLDVWNVSWDSFILRILWGHFHFHNLQVCRRTVEKW